MESLFHKVTVPKGSNPSANPSSSDDASVYTPLKRPYCVLHTRPLKVESALQGVRMLAPPIAAVTMGLLIDLVPGHPEVTRMASVVCLMAGWWVTEV